MARSSKMKTGFSTSIKPMKKAFGGKSSGMSAPSPLLKVGRKDYSKNTKPLDVRQFGMPGFGLTGLTGED